MKKNLLVLSVVALAIAFSAFTTSVATTVYLKYDGSGTERSISNFPIVSPATTYELVEPSAISGSGILNWFKVPNATSSTQVSQAQFNAAFDVLDTDDDFMLSDEADVAGELDVKD